MKFFFFLFLLVFICSACSSDLPKSDRKGRPVPAISIVPQMGHGNEGRGDTQLFMGVMDKSGRHLATFYEYSKIVKVWEVATGRLIRTVNNAEALYAASFSPDAKKMVTSSGKLFNLFDGKSRRTVKGVHNKIGFDPVGKYVWCAPGMMEPGVIQTIDGEKTKNVSVGGMFRVGGTLYASTKYGLANMETGETRKFSKGKKQRGYPIVDPSGSFVVVPLDTRAEVYGFQDGNFIKELRMGKNLFIKLVCFNKDGSRVAFSSAVTERHAAPSEVRIYDTGSFALLAKIGSNLTVPHFPSGPASVFELDGKVYSMNTGEIVAAKERFASDTTRFIAVSERGLVGFNGHDQLRHYPLGEGEPTTFTGKVLASNIGYAVDNSGAMLAFVDGTNTIKLLDLNGEGEVKTIKAGQPIVYVYFEGDHVSAVGESMGFSWDIKTLKQIKSFADTGFTRDVNRYVVNKKAEIPENTRFVSQVDGGLAILDPSRTATLATLYFGPGWYAIVTPDGYFDGNGEMDKYIAFVDDSLKTYSLKSFYTRFYRPLYVQDALHGKSQKGLSLAQAASFPAPEVEIVAPRSGSCVTDNHVSLEVKLSDVGGGVGDVYVYVNRNLVASAKGDNGGSHVFEKNIPVSPGDNVIEVVAYNGDNSVGSDVARWSVVADYKASKPVLYVVAIGIDKYKVEGINLSFCVTDAKGLVDILEGKSQSLFDKIQADLLTSPKQTEKKSIEDKLAQIADVASPQDYFLLYISSHGILSSNPEGQSSYYMVTSDVPALDNDTLADAALSQRDLTTLIGNIPSLQKTIILDTCHAGQVGKIIKETISSRESASVRASMGRFGITSGLNIFAASQSTQEAIEGYRGHGLFTYTLVEGLRGRADANGDGKVSFSELNDYVLNKVNRRSKKHFGREQVPYINITNENCLISAR